MKTQDGEDILEMLRRGEPVRDADLAGPLDLRALAEGDDVRVPVRIFGCRVRRLDAACLLFHAPVVLEGCTVESAEGAFFASYFLAGLHVLSCSFGSAVDFQCGGHNKDPRAVVIEGTALAGFVNFFDCWFEGPVAVLGCRFEGGTNLLGNKGQPFEGRIDSPPVIETNPRLNLIVLKTHRLDLLKEFYSALGISFVEERHGDGPLHLAARVGDLVLELYPLPTDTGLAGGTTAGLLGARPRRGDAVAGGVAGGRGQPAAGDAMGKEGRRPRPGRAGGGGGAGVTGTPEVVR